MFDGLDDILGFVVFIIWLLVQVGAAAKKKQQAAVTPKPAKRVAATGSPPKQRRAEASVAALAADPGSAGRISPIVSAPASDPIGAALARLDEEAARTANELDGGGVSGRALAETVRASVKDPLEQVTSRWREVQRIAAGGGRVANMATHADVTTRWARELSRRLGVIRRLADARAYVRDDAGNDDADAIAASFLRPFSEFAAAQEIGFPAQRPIAVPSRPGREEPWTEAIPDHPIVQVPLNFGDDLFWWTSVPHAIAHLLWERVTGLADEIVGSLGLQGTTQVLEPAYQPAQDLPHRLVRAWAPELFADALTVMLAGPAAVHGMMHAFDDPRVPVRLADVATDPDGTYDVHPPAVMRVMVAIRLLTRFGFDAEATQMRRAWNARHPDTTTLVVPISRGRTITYETESLAEYVARWSEAMCTEQFQSLDGHAFEHVPGFLLSPGLWRKVRDHAAELELDAAFRDDPRLVVAAAIEARHHNPGAAAAIRRAARAAIVGAHAPLSERRTERGSHVRSARIARFSRAELRDALVLADLAERRTGGRRPRPPRFSGRPAA